MLLKTVDVEPAPVDQDRPGLHVSSIIQAIKRAVDYRKDEKPLNQHVLDTGFIWEHLLEFAFKKLIGARPESVTMDGITGSPDGLDEQYVHEYKCTRTSADTEVESRWTWQMQMKAYCHMTKRTKAKLHVFYINGNGRDKRDPIYRIYEFQWTAKELKENWRTLLNNKDEISVEKTANKETAKKPKPSEHQPERSKWIVSTRRI